MWFVSNVTVVIIIGEVVAGTGPKIYASKNFNVPIEFADYTGSYELALTSNSESIYLVVTNNESSVNELYYFTSKWNGSWSSAQRLTFKNGEAHNPIIAINPQGFLNVVWRDTRDWNSNLFFTQLTTDGLTLVSDYRLTSYTNLTGEFLFDVQGFPLAGTLAPSFTIDASGFMHVSFTLSPFTFYPLPFTLHLCI